MSRGVQKETNRNLVLLLPHCTAHLVAAAPREKMRQPSSMAARGPVHLATRKNINNLS